VLPQSAVPPPRAPGKPAKGAVDAALR